MRNCGGTRASPGEAANSGPARESHDTEKCAEGRGVDAVREHPQARPPPARDPPGRQREKTRRRRPKPEAAKPRSATRNRARGETLAKRGMRKYPLRTTPAGRLAAHRPGRLHVATLAAGPGV